MAKIDNIWAQTRYRGNFTKGIATYSKNIDKNENAVFVRADAKMYVDKKVQKVASYR